MDRSVRATARRLLQTRLQQTTSIRRTFFGRPRAKSSAPRPQLPFLGLPQATEYARAITAQRKARIKFELLLALKWTFGGWALIGSVVAVLMLYKNEELERYYPTPHEWSFMTRLKYRLMEVIPELDYMPQDWHTFWEACTEVLEILEDPKYEGHGLEAIEELPFREPTCDLWPNTWTVYDTTSKSEQWRRGYYRALMDIAKACENTDGMVVDQSRYKIFFADQIIGPSNPNPRPVYPKQDPAPREEDDVCVRMAPDADIAYEKIYKTRGFSTKQIIDAALAHASWLQYKRQPEAAEKMHDWAISLATENIAPEALPFDTKTLVLRDGAQNVSANILSILTEKATLKVHNGDVAGALPIFISLLRARRSLPEPEPSAEPEIDPMQFPISKNSKWVDWSTVWRMIKHIVIEPEYPPPPPDGMSPPIRDAKELCEEAGLKLYIGEIVYSSSPSAREDGVGWTREAVDTAQEQLHKLGPKTSKKEAQIRCRECLRTGLGNWEKMVGRLAREEIEKQAMAAARKQKSGSWFGLWSESSSPGQEAGEGRWIAEKAVVEERTEKAQGLLGDLEEPSQGIWALFRS